MENIIKNRKMENKIQIISFIVNAQGEEIIISERVKKEYDKVKAIFINTDYGQVINLGSLNLKINRNEIFPKNMSANLINVTPFHSYKDIQYDINEHGRGALIEGVYNEIYTNSSAYPFEVQLYLICE